jgi:DNA-binding GntR family transcriptional regulator
MTELTVPSRDLWKAKRSTGQPDVGSMADRAYSHVIAALSDGTLKGGDLIQESRLADHLQLSRTPVRDALGRIEGEGLLVRSNRGLTVRRVTIKEFLDILHVRRLLEPEAAYLACGQLDSEYLFRLQDRVLRESTAGMNAEGWALDEEIHLTIVKGLKNDYLADLVRNMRRRTRLFELTEFPGRARSDREEHLDLLKSLISGDRDKAKAAMLRHLESLRDFIVESLKKM